MNPSQNFIFISHCVHFLLYLCFKLINKDLKNFINIILSAVISIIFKRFVPKKYKMEWLK
jgi:hypothetical protein